MSNDEVAGTEHKRTNRILYVLTHRDGTETTHDGGVVTKADVPHLGTGKWFNGVGYKVTRETFTPHLEVTWTCWCQEYG
ncbi:hypothetical protein M446_1861 [Methylobacterium sp. 4-46]|uniref:hypothetical protein n=1 Tax=unclassified Methylobacterium TaxID=2615210 RepID=UPI000165C9B8|nr:MULTISPECIES: hypothetical protein [Methylobacterium]ACA16343.1 hypothetical protein M446_1861 [Methylobacterium sp. 4-46]WFT82050.1 hypothetical protein QA634_09420 [Methylobacterium nodulans]